ncbi:gluconokinase [Alteromonas sp. KUL49]|uniref:gluconokinase n=1 Tax=Alteromonas sp. KUL49 TaxID=2480798 RepID=UPI00102EF25F|nr:gluconokinase [Alteromonas sp. KUL49]TAP38708.1 gluconokinase [Alteromonas sp. KUL49]GEA12660.1 gluconokinase [Alteromonas sp. KUL49]
MNKLGTQILVIGPSGCGKTSLGQAIAHELNCNFIDADDVHSQEAKECMEAGIPLTEEQRAPWLNRLKDILRDSESEGNTTVLAVSCLKRAHRSLLRSSVSNSLFLFLDLPKDVLQQRLESRESHFFPPALLESQLNTLEKPGSEEDVVTLDGTLSVKALCTTSMEIIDEINHNRTV